MTDDISREDKALASAALLAQTGETTGPPPTDEELARWVAHTLDEPRLSEVESHIAHSPGAFERAMTHVEDPAASTSAGSPWRAPLALAATAVIAVAGLTTLLRSPSSPTATPDEPQRIVRSATNTNLDWRSAALQAGYSSVPRDESLTAENLRIDQCLDGDCLRLAGVLYRYGALLAQLETGCASGTTGGAETVSELLDIEKAIAGSFELAPWLAPIRQLRSSVDSGSDATCAEVEALLDRYLSGN